MLVSSSEISKNGPTNGSWSANAPACGANAHYIYMCILEMSDELK